MTNSGLASMVNQITQIPTPRDTRINKEDYELWKKHAVWDGLRGLRYGQSFCNHFNITDNLLYYSLTWDSADQYIKKTYID
jgi:hypothetical protein